MNRRDVLRLSLVGGGAVALSKQQLFGRARPLAFDDLPPSPATTPFIQPLPKPPLIQPVAALPSAPECSLPAQYAGPAPKLYHVVQEQAFVQVHPQLAPTRVWRYRPANVANWPFVAGPTFVGRANNALIVRHQNNLPANHVGFGVPYTTVHLHGGHHEARSDGFPDDVAGLQPVIPPGGHYDYCFPLLDPGFAHGAPDATDRPSTLWYHDHLLDFTGPNVYRGMAGFFLFQDEKDAHDENLNDGVNLRLPSGEHDVPMVFQDRQIDAQGQLVYDVFQHNGFLGDKFLVNGAIQPFLEVKRRKYRFRWLNGSNARFYQLFIVRPSGQTVPFDYIATEAGLMSAPIRGRTSVFMGVAERADIVVDFAAFPAGTKLYIENRLRQDDGRGPNGTLNPGKRLLELRVVGGTVADPSRSPDVLRPFTAITAAEIAAATRRTFVFKRQGGVWVINDQTVDLNVPMATVRLNQPEVWTFINNGGGWWHPIHVHLEFMHVLKRNGALPPLDERDGRAKKDVVDLGPNESVEAFFKFRDFPGPWVFHCHNVEHEDAFMMARFDVVP